MDSYQRALMEAPSIEGDCCAICGKFPAEKHHVVFRSQGGTSGATIPLCGFGNTSGCHGLAHQYRLHFNYVSEVLSEDGIGYWEYIITEVPTKHHEAAKQNGWERIGYKPIKTKVSREERLEWLKEIPI